MRRNLVEPAASRAPRPRRGIARDTRRPRGFTLIETLVVVAIAAVLSSVALPGFERVLQRVRRAEAVVTMLQIQAAQERFRSNANRYGELAEIGAPSVSAARHYTLETRVVDGVGYDVAATAVGVQARDAACRHLALHVVGGATVTASGPDAALDNPAPQNRACWLS